MAKKIPLEQLEGAISVQGDVTPITRNPVENVTANEWNEMTINQLHSQREILVQRYYGALSGGMTQGAETIQMGIMTIDAKLEEMGEMLGGDALGFL
jgi:hypothetical protein